MTKMFSVDQSQVLKICKVFINFYQAQVWYSDHFGWPITARPYASTSTQDFVEVSEVLNQIVRRACLFKPLEDIKPSTVSTSTISTSAPTKSRAKVAETLKEPVQAVLSYPDLVSLISTFMERP